MRFVHAAGRTFVGRYKVRSKKWVLTEVVADGAATSEIGSERKNSILFTADSRIGSVVVTDSVATRLRGITGPRAAAASAEEAAEVAAECRLKSSAKAKAP